MKINFIIDLISFLSLILAEISDQTVYIFSFIELIKLV